MESGERGLISLFTGLLPSTQAHLLTNSEDFLLHCLAQSEARESRGCEQQSVLTRQVHMGIAVACVDSVLTSQPAPFSYSVLVSSSSGLPRWRTPATPHSGKATLTPAWSFTGSMCEHLSNFNSQDSSSTWSSCLTRQLPPSGFC